MVNHEFHKIIYENIDTTYTDGIHNYKHYYDNETDKHFIQNINNSSDIISSVTPLKDLSYILQNKITIVEIINTTQASINAPLT